MPITLEPWKIEYLDDLVKYANNPSIAKNLTDAFPYPYTKEAGKQFIETVSKSNPTLVFAIVKDSEIIGSIGIHPQQDIYRNNVELGYWLAEPFWGQNIMTTAISQIVEYAFKNLPINRIFAKPFGYNIGSQKALLKSGFVLEGKYEKTLIKNGELIDELVFAIRKTEE
jgi:ribosomal-protein-alanine N-acetyltransferase